MNKLYIVGIGPGDYEDMTLRAIHALERCQLIVGYSVYVDLIRPYFPDKEFFTSPMTQEAVRCQYALDEAAAGKTCALICSGDAGVYGMAGLALELRGERDCPSIEIISGLTAATAGAALLGAPLSNDFVVISLSDLLTPWTIIEKRLRAAAQGELCVVLYNPGSRKRRDHLLRACDILLSSRSPDTLCGVVRSISREGESQALMTLSELRGYPADMYTTVFVGNSHTRKIGNKMVTARGYRDV